MRAALLILAVFLPFLVFADPTTGGKIQITVKEFTGQPAFGALITLKSVSPATVSTSVTAEDGTAIFQNVKPGAYSLTATKDGFDAASSDNIQVRAGMPVDIALTLVPETVRSSVEVTATTPAAVERTGSDSTSVKPSDVRDLPSRPATVNDALPLLPGVVRSADGEIKISGTGEHRSAFLVNFADVTDPATGRFGQGVPVDSVQEVQVFKTPFMAQYGRFTSGVVTVETRRGGDKWHAELNDPLPDFRFRSWHMVGIRDISPRAVFSGPIIAGKLYFAQTIQYDLKKTPERTLPYPFNESKQESANSFTQVDYILSSKQVITATVHIAPQHTNFVDPNFFNPQPVTPNFAQHNYAGTLIDHYAIGNGMLDSTLSFQRFDGRVGSQGTQDMILAPQGNAGNYFSTQDRQAGRTEWLETYSPAALHDFGTHELKFGTALARTSDNGEFTARPIHILDQNGVLLRSIDFVGGAPYIRNDVEASMFAQDHWALTPKFLLDLGARLERQNLAESYRLAPRIGAAWTPFANHNTIIRAGYGIFYDRVPLNVYTFTKYPQQLITNYAADGSIAGDPLLYYNLTGFTLNPKSLLIHSDSEPGNFTPHSSTWNVQVEQPLTHWLRLRATYTDSNSSGLVTIEPQSLQGTNAYLLNGGGKSQYRQAELTARVSLKSGREMLFAYTRSKAQGDLNDFNTFLGNFPSPLIRPDVYSNLPGDLPNRFLAWGRIALPGRLQVLPTVEYRNGFPYAQYDVLGNYIGTPNSDRTRFPNFFSTDARIIKDIPVNNKYTLRFSLSGFNLTNHFNALAVHSNVADPEYGVFFGNYRRRFRIDFDVVF